MYKLIAIDLDGTLLDDHKRIPEDNLVVIRELIDRGYEIVIATGRRYWEAKELIKDIDRNIVILANNGNIVREYENDRLIIKKYLNMEDFRKLIRESKKRNLHPLIMVDDYENGIDIIVESGNATDFHKIYISRAKDRYKEVEDYLTMEDANILSVAFAGKKEDMKGLYEYINERYPNIYKAHLMENMNLVEALLEIMNPLGDKWLSLLEYAKEKGIDKTEIIAIGDDNNDIEMIKNSGCGIAMKNGSKYVKEVADIISEKDNNQSGVAHELRKLLKIHINQ
jgi:Cof subfamily protein (haloacid dehalogenase superfamily)